jgi:uncharacterized protein (DUF1800 family)
MTLFWHDHFATRDQETPWMLRQNRMLRRYCLGDFDKLLAKVTTDPAMQVFLSLADSSKWAPNENYARELMELFTLGKGYTERDIREAARALTGWRARWTDSGFRGIYYDRTWHDKRVKRIFHKRGRFDWRDVIKLVTAHRRHAPFLVEKLWAYFITAPLDAQTRKALIATYRRSGHKIKPVVEKILRHPALYADLDRPDMVKSPVVFLAGALRSAGGGIQRDSWTWLLDMMGQQLFRPPSVAGWDWGTAWLSTNAMQARVELAASLVSVGSRTLRVRSGRAAADWTPRKHVDAALETMGQPWIAHDTRAALHDVADGFHAGRPSGASAQALQRLLCQLVVSGPDAQVC